VPKFKFFKTAERLPSVISADDFAKLIKACEHATKPGDVPNVAAGDWWRALLVTAYLTGWRIGSLLELTWRDANLDTGIAISRAQHNKGKRDVAIDLHPLVIAQMRKLEGGKLAAGTHVFPWNHNRRQLWREFYKLQDVAGVKPDAKERFGFHCLRRSFASTQAENLDLFELQRLMQHKSLETTRLYVNMAKRLKPTVQRLTVPDALAAVAM
jgi:integrase